MTTHQPFRRLRPKDSSPEVHPSPSHQVSNPNLCIRRYQPITLPLTTPSSRSLLAFTYMYYVTHPGDMPAHVPRAVRYALPFRAAATSAVSTLGMTAGSEGLESARKEGCD